MKYRIISVGIILFFMFAIPFWILSGSVPQLHTFKDGKVGLKVYYTLPREFKNHHDLIVVVPGECWECYCREAFNGDPVTDGFTQYYRFLFEKEQNTFWGKTVEIRFYPKDDKCDIDELKAKLMDGRALILPLRWR